MSRPSSEQVELGWTVHILIRVDPDGTAHEATQEFADFRSAIAAIAALPGQDFSVLSLYRTEMQPKMLEGAVPDTPEPG